MIKAHWIPIDIQWTGRPPQEATPTRMLNKKQVLEMFGVAPTSPIRKEIFQQLPEYNNPFNQHACYREEDVIRLLRSLPLNPTTSETTTTSEPCAP